MDLTVFVCVSSPALLSIEFLASQQQSLELQTRATPFTTGFGAKHDYAVGCLLAFFFFFFFFFFWPYTVGLSQGDTASGDFAWCQLFVDRERAVSSLEGMPDGVFVIWSAPSTVGPQYRKKEERKKKAM